MLGPLHFVDAAENPITITSTARADATSILGVMALGAMHGDEVTLSAEDEAFADLDRLVELLSQDLES